MSRGRSRMWHNVLPIVVLLMVLSVGFGPTTWADTPKLHESIAELEPLLGTWEIDARWSFGAEMWAKGQYRPAVDGRFVEVRTWVSDNGGPVYLRYHSMIGVDSETGQLTARSFGHDGSFSSVIYEKTAPGRFDYRWQMGATEIKERLDIDGEKTRWQVWSRAESGADWQPLMDGYWHLKQPFEEKASVSEIDPSSPFSPPTAPIDDSQFVASGPDLRKLELTQTIQADTHEVFAAFTDGNAFVQAYGPDREGLSAAIELAIGGRYEWLFDGKIGSNGCRVLTYIPQRLISFTWNAPPTQADNREKRTWVVVELSEDPSGATHVRLTHLGFGEGPDWDETYGYFEKAWAHVLSTFKQNLEAG